MSQDAWERFRDEGFRHYQVVAAGFKYRMMDLQAAIGIHQLDRVEETHARREELWRLYDEAFSELPCELPAAAEPDTVHARHLYTLVVDESLHRDRNRVLEELTRRKIGVGVHYKALHTHPYYRELLGHASADFPNAYEIGERTFSIPMSAKLTDGDVDDVIEGVRAALGSR